MMKDLPSARPSLYIKSALVVGIFFTFYDYKRRTMIERLMYAEYENRYGTLNQKLNMARVGEENKVLGAMEYLT